MKKKRKSHNQRSSGSDVPMIWKAAAIIAPLSEFLDSLELRGEVEVGVTEDGDEIPLFRDATEKGHWDFLSAFRGLIVFVKACAERSGAEIDLMPFAQLHDTLSASGEISESLILEVRDTMCKSQKIIATTRYAVAVGIMREIAESKLTYREFIENADSTVHE